MSKVPLLLVAHGNLARALLRSSEMLIGKRKDIYTLGLKEGDGLTNFIDKVQDALAALKDAESILAFVDLRGGTPWNAVMGSNDPRIRLVSGISLPILLEVLIKRDSVDDADALVQCAMDAAAVSVSHIRISN